MIRRHVVRCTHCGASRRSVSLWDQILSLGRPTVCCRLLTIEPPKTQRGTNR